MAANKIGNQSAPRAPALKPSAALLALDREFLTSLVQAKDQYTAVRVWLPGCGTGEEAYQVACLLSERAAAAHKKLELQVFASDIDSAALNVARRGRYPHRIGGRRAGGFFTPVNGHCYETTRSLRELIVFACHDVVDDPPFSRLDLICCRDLLTCLTLEARHKVLGLFHFGLSAGGFLCLGANEDVGKHSERFALVSRQWRIFRCVRPAPEARAKLLNGSSAKRDAGGVSKVFPAGRPPNIQDRTRQASGDARAPVAADERERRHLLALLPSARDERQSSIAEMAFSSEQLQAANEEMTSMNEELQSTNEELEASRKELQSLNEELNAVNSQLQDKVSELEAANNDLANLLASSDIATIFLDTRLRVKRYTAATRNVLNLLPGDVGRPFKDLTRRFIDPDLLDDAKDVLSTLRPVEKEVRSAAGGWYLRRLLPYRAAQGTIEGVVVTLTDVTALKEARADLERRVQQRTAELESVNQQLRSEIAERRALERQLLEVATAEQRRIGQDLHDGLGQELTGLSLMAQSLLEVLPQRGSPEAKIAARVADGLKRTVKRVRILSRGLVPVEVGAAGLMAALSDLAARACELQDVQCTFDCAVPALVEDNITATHLYHIAQEAVTNALKHGQVRHIQIGLQCDEHALTLTVADDGIGLPEVPQHSGGLGLRIMRYRAGLINAVLEIGRADGRGTLVRCTLHKEKNHGLSTTCSR
jgi:signal transduction histidine kinase/chemotaxis methyl-accepting protein methylase